MLSEEWRDLRFNIVDRIIGTKMTPALALHSSHMKRVGAPEMWVDLGRLREVLWPGPPGKKVSNSIVIPRLSCKHLSTVKYPRLVEREENQWEGRVSKQKRGPQSGDL